MRNQSSNLVVAPRAGFEPATNRLTARCHSITTRFNSCADRLTGNVVKSSGWRRQRARFGAKSSRREKGGGG